jgi:predicted metal-dependent hydrolase
VRVSRRARRISLRVAPGKGLEVVLPVGTDPADCASMVPALLERYRHWIERAMRRLAGYRPKPFPALPASLLLEGGRERISLLPGARDARTLIEAPSPPDGRAGPGGDETARGHDLSALMRGRAARAERALLLPDVAPDIMAALVREWLRGEARRRFGPRLAALADAHGFKYERVALRLQRSRWGSCSSKGTISLNIGLIFLPEVLSNYILLHELCHTRCMNHGPGFWKLVFAADPDALRKNRAMRSAWRHIPAWFRG